jgi:hypothetical protein
MGLLVLALALRSFSNVGLRRAGILALLAASYVGAYFIFRQHLAGIAAVLAWFFLPWVELLTRIRALRLPLEKKLEHMAPPSARRFPGLESLTEDIEEQGFDYVDDAGWEWDKLEQFFRIFYNPKDRLLTMVCLNEQNEIGFVHLTISCRDRQGRTWKTWDYPFSYSLQSSPDLCLNRVEPGGSFADLKQAHLDFLEENGVSPEELIDEDLEQVHGIMEQEVRGQIDHNLTRGIIRKSGEGTFRYSWRGLFFLWTQVLKDMVKLF